ASASFRVEHSRAAWLPAARITMARSPVLGGGDVAGPTPLASPPALPRLLQPHLIRWCFLPAFVGGARSDQVNIGAKIFAVTAGAIARAALTQPKILRRKFVRRHHEPLINVAALAMDCSLNRLCISDAPDLVPIGQRRVGASRLEDLGARGE